MEERGIIWSVFVLLMLTSPGHVSAIDDLDYDLVNDIFGSDMDSARYGNLESEDENWEVIPTQQLPSDNDCGPMVNPSPEPPMMELHEELKVIQVIKAAQDLKCSHYLDQGYECVPYYNCDENGEIITDGYGLMDIRSGLTSQEPNFGILDSSDEMCPGSLDVCCKDAMFSTTPAPTTTTSTTTESSSGGGGYNPGGRDDYDDSEEDNGGGEQNGGGGYHPSDENSSEEDYDDNNNNNGGECIYGQCSKPLEPQFKPRCGRRNHYGLGVRIQGFKEGESQFGEWPHICAVLQIDEQADGYVTKEVKVFTGGASLLAPGAALTAAHKVQPFVDIPEKLVVRCGEWDTQTNSEPLKHQDRTVKKIIIHPEYNRRNLAYTSALLILDSDFELSQHVDTICLPELNDKYVEDTDCHVKGWGKDKWEDGEYQVILKSVRMPMVPTDTCLNQLRTTKLGKRFRLHNSFVCAGGEAGKDACFGDGGGPLVCPLKHDPERYVQVGIVAWGIGCGEGIPGVYTSLTALGCWIDYELKCNLGDAYHMRYDAKSCDNWFYTNKQRNPNRYQCQVHWPERSEYQREVDEELKSEEEYKTQTGPIKIEKSAPSGGGYY
eukprot:TRINITY_DN661_c0_g1_i1.p1 TRINITY_DN661_c0_g1~~TRINITY_DN661_c0_g1_i1.p1  ORF type:complete len:605 (+),score=163.65 TRINITY_DN661_c0_g1_i1:52-1866(+)